MADRPLGSPPRRDGVDWWDIGVGAALFLYFVPRWLSEPLPFLAEPASRAEVLVVAYLVLWIANRLSRAQKGEE